MNAVMASAAILIHLFVLVLPIHSFVFMTLHYYIGETCHFQFQGPWSVPSSQARFSGEIPESHEDDFSRNPEGLTLQAEQGGALPLPANWNDGAILLAPLASRKREYRVIFRVKGDGRIERDAFLPLEALDDLGTAGREKLLQMCVGQFLVQDAPEHQQPAPVMVALGHLGTDDDFPALHLGR